jgi:hypothetical protein
MIGIKNIITGRYATIRHFYLVSFTLAVAAFIFSAVFLVNDYLKFKSNIDYDLRVHNERIEQKFSDSLFYTKLIMSYVGRQIANHGDVHDYNFIKNLLNSYRMPDNGLMSWSVLSWVDDQHRIVVSRNVGLIKETKDLSDRDYIPLTVQYPETIHMGKPVYGMMSGLYSIPLGYGVIDTHRRYIGAVVSGIIIRNLQSQIEELIGNSDISFAIFDTNGNLIAQSVSSDFSDKTIKKILSKMTESNSSKFFYKNSYYKKLEEYPYVIATIYNKNASDSSAQIRLSIYLLVIFLLISFISLIFYGFHRNLISPILQLSRIADKIYRRDSDRKIPKFEVQEIDDLAKNLQKIDNLISNDKFKHR